MIPRVLIPHHTTPSQVGEGCCWLDALLGRVHRLLSRETRSSMKVPDQPDPPSQPAEPPPGPPTEEAQDSNGSDSVSRVRNIPELVAYILDSGKRTARCTFLILTIAVAVGVIVGCALLLVSTPEVHAHIGLPKANSEFLGGVGLSSAGVAVITIIGWLWRRRRGGTPG